LLAAAGAEGLPGCILVDVLDDRVDVRQREVVPFKEALGGGGGILCGMFSKTC
jgi:hypothetical protein